MINVDEVIALQTETVEKWHDVEISNDFEGVMGIVCAQHIFNFELWHQEDIARSPDVTDGEIGNVKRAIDKLNQNRNDWIEKIDDWISESLESQSVETVDGAPLNTETPGSVVDRLSIMSLRIYHLIEQLDRKDVSDQHRESVQRKIAVCRLQQNDLGNSLKELLADISAGTKRHRTYRQFKMYNDPTLNPYLYGAKKAG